MSQKENHVLEIMLKELKNDPYMSTFLILIKNHQSETPLFNEAFKKVKLTKYISYIKCTEWNHNFFFAELRILR